MSSGYDFDAIVEQLDSPARQAMRAVTEATEATRRQLEEMDHRIDLLTEQCDLQRKRAEWYADRCEELERDLAMAKDTIARLEREIP